MHDLVFVYGLFLKFKTLSLFICRESVSPISYSQRKPVNNSNDIEAAITNIAVEDTLQITVPSTNNVTEDQPSQITGQLSCFNSLVFLMWF